MNETTKKPLLKFADIASKLKRFTVEKNMLGADPEFFVKRNGRVIGSEKVVKENKLVVEDGVQVEIHPQPSYCRALLSDNIRDCFYSLNEMLTGSKATVTHEVSVDVSKRQYNSLKEKNKQFGCGRSFNAHEIVVEKVEPSVYLKRSAGGHMHFGGSSDFYTMSSKLINVLADPDRLVPVLDVLVGNTAVMLDRDDGNIERRKHYGLAGEFRTPVYGVEYRTLSNFWLRGEPLMSLMFGLARHAIGTCTSDQDNLLLSLVEMDDIIKAINTNDYELAKSNWDKYKGFLLATSNRDTLSVIRSEDDIRFFERVATEGIDKWFSKDIMANWIGKDAYKILVGWNEWQDRVVHKDRRDAIATKTSCTA